MNVKMFRLGDVANITTGRTPSKARQEYYKNGTIPFVKPPNLNKYHEVIETDEYLSDKGAAFANIIPKGSIMVSCIGSLGKVGIAGTNLATNQQINSLSFKEDLVYYKYGYYVALTFKNELKRIANNAVVPIVNKTTFSNLEIPVPTLKDQIRISSLLDNANMLRQKRQQSLNLLDNYLRSVFLELFGNPIRNPHKYNVQELRTLIDNIQSGWSAQGENRKAGEGEIGVLKISAVTSGTFRPDENKFVKNTNGKSLIRPKNGDLLFSRANTRELVAATCIVDADYENLFLPDKLWKISPKKNIANSWFLHFLISDESFRDILRSKATGTSGSMLNISQQKFLETICYVPPIELQNKFASIVQNTMETKMKMSNQAKEINDLFNSRMQKIFA